MWRGIIKPQRYTNMTSGQELSPTLSAAGMHGLGRFHRAHDMIQTLKENQSQPDPRPENRRPARVSSARSGRFRFDGCQVSGFDDSNPELKKPVCCVTHNCSL